MGWHANICDDDAANDNGVDITDESDGTLIAIVYGADNARRIVQLHSENAALSAGLDMALDFLKKARRQAEQLP